MKIVSISQDYFDLVDGDRELMLKRDRPCIVVVRLRFRGKRRDFAVPLRSNIAPNVPKDQYFALPPRPTTRPGCRHGIHYIKMFPITKAYQCRFRTEGSAYYETLQRIIDGNKVLEANFNKNYFAKIDIRIDKEIKFYSKSARILTMHPSGSYTLTPDVNKQYVLRITNPQLFWSTSKYLVVLVK